jgi:Spy/CpxP family protein refolding chaperone
MLSKLLLIAMLAASFGVAQRSGGGGGKGGSKGGGAPMMGASRPNKLEQMNTVLQLSKEQKKDVKTIMDEAQKEAAPLKEELMKSRGEVAAAIESGKQDDIDKAIKSHSELEARMTSIEMKAFAGIYKMLDPDQRNKTRMVFVMMPGIFNAKNWADAE